MADGWAARAYDELQLRESEEMREDRDYLRAARRRTAAARGSRRNGAWRGAIPQPRSSVVAEQEHVDLIAMSTHGHRLLSDLIRGTTVDRVRHTVSMPVLLLKAKHTG